MHKHTTHTKTNAHTSTHTSHLVMDVLRGRNTWWDGRQLVCLCLFSVSVCAKEGGDCIRESHTQFHSPGDLCQPVILPCTPPVSPPSSAAHCRNRSTTHNAGAMRSKCVAPALSLSSPNIHVTSTVQQEKKQAMAPPWTHTQAGSGQTGTASHNIPTFQPQQPFTKPRLNRADSGDSYGMCAHSQDEFSPNGLECSSPKN